MMTPERFTHSVGVAETARLLAHEFNGDPEKAYLAGILHDIARDLAPEALLREAAKKGIILEEGEKACPTLLHGKVAACIAQRELGIRDQEVLRAISSHVTGRPGWTRLEQVVYLADKVEPARDYPGVEKVRSLLEKGDFEGALLEALANAIIYVTQNQGFLDPKTVVVFNEIAKIKRSSC